MVWEKGNIHSELLSGQAETLLHRSRCHGINHRHLANQRGLCRPKTNYITILYNKFIDNKAQHFPRRHDWVLWGKCLISEGRDGVWRGFARTCCLSLAGLVSCQPHLLSPPLSPPLPPRLGGKTEWRERAAPQDTSPPLLRSLFVILQFVVRSGPARHPGTRPAHAQFAFI